MGTFRRRASASASGPHCHHSTGLSACWSRYGLVALARRFMPPGSHVNVDDTGQVGGARSTLLRMSGTMTRYRNTASQIPRRLDECGKPGYMADPVHELRK